MNIKKIILILLIQTTLLNAQNNTQITNLEKQKTILKENIIKLNDSIKKIDLIISKLNSKEFLSQIKDSSIIATAIKNATLRTKPSVTDDVIMTLEESKKVRVLDYHNGYFGVCIDSFCGYMSDVWIHRNEKVDKLMQLRTQEKEELEKLKEEQKIKKQNNQYAIIESRNIKKYGKTLYEKLKKGYYWIGMTDKMAIIALGLPDDINRSVGSWGIQEQWVYKGAYYYFENGKLKSYQN